jgi:hypothetical protein
MHGYTIDIHWVLMDTVEEVHMIAFPRRAMGMRTCTADQTILQIHNLLENFDEDKPNLHRHEQQAPFVESI